tara:strand:+ start:623 stop:850 length:228 start_codon:yes stop_codon:yes gene_type:complete
MGKGIAYYPRNMIIINLIKDMSPSTLGRENTLVAQMSQMMTAKRLRHIRCRSQLRNSLGLFHAAQDKLKPPGIPQ